jgi:uncharacterized protein YeaO (DUF488 family)
VIRIVRLGSDRAADEGLRIGTVRRPPRGVPKSEYSRRDLYDVWLPNLAPSEVLLKTFQRACLQHGEDEREWRRFVRAYRKEMSAPEVSRVLDTLAALSHHANFSVGCYCLDAEHCHRSILRDLLARRGAAMHPDD